MVNRSSSSILTKCGVVTRCPDLQSSGSGFLTVGTIAFDQVPGSGTAGGDRVSRIREGGGIGKPDKLLRLSTRQFQASMTGINDSDPQVLWVQREN